MAGRDLNTLVNSTILPNLCPPPDPKLFPEGIRTPWIKPGRAVWRYLDGGPEGVDGMKELGLDPASDEFNSIVAMERDRREEEAIGQLFKPSRLGCGSPYYPRDGDPSPWQENAIRILEG